MSNFIIKNNAIFKLGAVFFAICFLQLNILNAADQFNEATNILKQAHESGQTTLGMIILWGVVIAFPVMAFLGMFAGYKFAKQKADQEKDSKIIYWALFIGAIVGFVLYILIVSLVSYALTNDTGTIFDSISKFITGSLNKVN